MDSSSTPPAAIKNLVQLSPLWQFQQKLRNDNLVKVEFQAELLDCIKLYRST